MEEEAPQSELKLEPQRKEGRVWFSLKLTNFLAAISCLVLDYNKTAVLLLLLSLLMGLYTSFKIRQEDIEKLVQKFWFGLTEKGLVNIIFLMLFLRILWRPFHDFPTILCLGLITITLRNLFYLAFSVSLLKEEKALPLNSIWGKITTLSLNITMLLYALRVEKLPLKVWKIQKDIQNFSNIFMVISLLLIFATSLGYLYFYYRDPDHRKPFSVASQLTFSRIILSPVFIWVFFYDNNLTYQDNNLIFKFLALFMVISFAISDGLDGHLARKFGQVSKLGKYLDPFSDKISTMSIFLCFLASDYANVWMIALIYFREATIETLRTLAAGENVVLDARRSGKWKTAIQLTVIITILIGAIADTIIMRYWPDIPHWPQVWNWIPYTLMYIVALVTILSGVDYIIGNLKVLKRYI
ncbi:MAG: CDP-diacylglycerol--glycerol-3-phosphate 3-phosphatidyltransferase [Fibrobacteria bacterium]|nr:CDP-diacylglycerol--glycerol-3-phosphate 3-phosphatidyltransferase [Fibrobacteria bacterium]